MILLQHVQEVLPISGTDWEIIADMHSSYYPEKNRLWEDLKRKYQKLVRMNIPTGNPQCPEAVRLAKHIEDLIVAKTNGDTGSRDNEVLSPEDEIGEDEEQQGHADGEAFSTPRRRATPITRGRRGRNRWGGDDDDEPSFSNIMELMAEQNRNDIERREQERLDQREAREARMEEQREERRMQYQMQSQMQMQMMQQSQQMQAQMMAMMAMMSNTRGVRGHDQVNDHVNDSNQVTETNSDIN